MLCRSAKHEQVRLAASIALLDRGFGRPQQTVELTAREAASEGQLSMDALFEGLSHEDRETFTRMLEEASRGREVLDLKASPPAVGELGHAS